MSKKHAACAALVALLAATEARSEPLPFHPVKVDEVATGYGTFQSHNQKIVENRYGIFMTYLYSEDDTPLGTWRLARSVDGGSSWEVISRGHERTNAPALETDENGSVYLIHSDYDTGDATFLRFDPAKGFRDPVESTIPRGSAGKFASHYDAVRKRIYYATFWDCESATRCETPNFFALDLSGGVIFSKGLTLTGTTPLPPYGARYRLQYPHLAMSGADIWFAWTTTPIDRPENDCKAGNPCTVPHLYRSILYIRSGDGGLTWTAPLTGEVLQTPIVGDDTGPARRVTLDHETGRSNWLSSFTAKGGHLHFMFVSAAVAPGQEPDEERYVRFDAATGARDGLASLAGTDMALQGLDGFFATDEAPAAPLFAVGHYGRRIGVMRSSDGGRSWQPHAASAATFDALYAVSGSRRLAANGDILGHFSQGTSVYFFRVPGAARP